VSGDIAQLFLNLGTGLLYCTRGFLYCTRGLLYFTCGLLYCTRGLLYCTRGLLYCTCGLLYCTCGLFTVRVVYSDTELMFSLNLNRDPAIRSAISRCQ
jgi:hypothetical protein